MTSRSSSHAAPSPPFGLVLREPYTDITTLYDLGKELGRGNFGITYLCTEKSTGLEYASKSIPKTKLATEWDREYVRREIKILKHLKGQPNIVEFKGAYEDLEYLHLVMELCSGGDLFHRIEKKGKYSEKDAARIGRQILNVVQACHFMGVMHRDLKPENFLMVTIDENSSLKATDFGLSVFIEEGKVYHDRLGTMYYVAPEVLEGYYGKEIDVWSAGVILYMLLTGIHPFRLDTKTNDILIGNVEILLSRLRPPISDGAKDLITRMLTHDPKNRITPAEALEHPWLKMDGEASDKPIDSVVQIRMKQLRDMNKLKKLALKVIAEKLSDEEVKGVKQMFINMDTDGSGYITYEKLKTGLYKLGSNLSEAEIHQLLEAADIDNDGRIDYIEFITATMHRYRLDKDENLQNAFQHFDKDNSGYITRDELKQALTQYGMGDEATIDKVLEDVDTDKDGKINYDEFLAMMRRGTV